jgi:hypothetical protein
VQPTEELMRSSPIEVMARRRCYRESDEQRSKTAIAAASTSRMVHEAMAACTPPAFVLRG